MRLLVTTGNKKEFVEGRNIEIPANSVDFVLAKASTRDIVALKDEPNVTLLKVDYELGDLWVARAKITAPNAIGGATTTTLTLQLVDQYDLPIFEDLVVALGVFDEAEAATPATNASLNTASEGTILGGAGTAALKVRMSTSGKFVCIMTNLVDETVHSAIDGSYASPIVDGRGVTATVFSA